MSGAAQTAVTDIRQNRKGFQDSLFLTRRPAAANEYHNRIDARGANGYRDDDDELSDARKRHRMVRADLELLHPDPQRSGSCIRLEALEFLFADELSREVDPGASGFQHLRVEQRPVLEEQVRTAIAARSREGIVFDAHGLAERELPQKIT